METVLRMNGNSQGTGNVPAFRKDWFERRIKIVADGGYGGERIEKPQTIFGWIREIVLISDHSGNFAVISEDGLSKELLRGFLCPEGETKVF